MRNTELKEEFEEAADVEGDIGDELAVLPIGLDGDPHVNSVRDTPGPRHFPVLRSLAYTLPFSPPRRKKDDRAPR